MDLEQIKKEAEKIKALDFSKMPPEKIDEVVEQLLSMLGTTEQHLSELKIEDYE